MKFIEKGEDSGKNFVRLKAGESITGVFREEPYHFKQHWDNAAKRSHLCTENAECEWCKKEPKKKAGFRFRLNMVTKEKETGEYTAKVFEQGWPTYLALRSLQEAGYEIEKTVVQVTRTGEGTETKYTILPLAGKNGTVTPELEKKLSAVTLHNLENPVDGELSDGGSEPKSTGDDDIPF